MDTVANRNTLMIIVAILLAVAGLTGFYYFQQSDLWLRVLILALGLILGAGAFIFLSQPGARFIALLKESWIEVGKVVWPTKQEANVTTLIVFGFVFLMALFLWITDKGLEWVLYQLILGWTK